MDDIMRKIADLPKLELHTHIEGTITPTLLKKLAKRNGVKGVESLYEFDNHYQWNDFHAFLNGYDLVAQCVQSKQDYYDVVYEYLAQCADEKVIYVEYFASPDHGWSAGLSYDDMLDCHGAAIKDAERDFGIICRGILTAIRHLGQAKCDKVAELLNTTKSEVIVGFGFAGDEVNFPAQDFVSCFQIAHAAGYPATAHAGEAQGAESVKTCLDLLPITRIGHGVRASESDAVVAELIARNITLEVCPGSNIALKIYPDYASHPLRQLVEAGVKVCLNSDDPPHFQTTVGLEYKRAAETFGFSASEILAFSQNAVDAAFCRPDIKQHLNGILQDANGKL